MKTRDSFWKKSALRYEEKLFEERVELEGAGFVRRNISQNATDEQKSYLRNEMRYRYPKISYYRISDVWLDGCLTSKNNRILSSICLQNGRKRNLITDHKSGIRYESLEEGIWILDNWSHGYFHWLTDAVPRLLLLRSYLDSVDAPVLIPNDLWEIGFVRESLCRIYGNFHIYDARKMLRVQQLHTVSFVAGSGNYRPNVLTKIRRVYENSATKNPRKRVFVSRSKSNKRSLINEEELTDLLGRFGFETHHFESMSFSQQVELMGQTSVLLGIHGAGLSNMIFMPSNGSVIELRNQSMKRDNCYFSMADALGLNYRLSLTTPADLGLYNRNADTICDLNAVEALLTAEEQNQ